MILGRGSLLIRPLIVVDKFNTGEVMLQGCASRDKCRSASLNSG